MKKLSIVGLILFLAACASNPPVEYEAVQSSDSEKATEDCKSTSQSSDLMVIGEVEYVTVEDAFTQQARIDTGAQTTSIDARNIKKFERDGKAWVDFELHGRDKQVQHFKLPVSRTVNIKRHGGEPIERYVVQMNVKIGEHAELIDVSLADRESFEYAILIGRNFLQGHALVDVRHKFLALDEAKE